MKNIIKISHRKKIFAIIVKAGFKKKGIKFFTPNDYPQQLACISRPRDYIIIPHIHNSFAKEIKTLQETLFIKKGKVRIDFYDKKKNYLESRILHRGDVVLLAFGGHGLEFIEGAEIIEVKQGPFISKAQPERFISVAKNKLKIKR